MHSKKTADEAVEHTAKGLFSQVKGNLKEAWGSLTDNPKTKLEGRIDRVKGRLQEDYGRLKADQADIEKQYRALDDDDTLRMK